ncbi:hypothetical protein BKA83DRAFT_14986 [Pisolithus microcarpus]|nr:hypothetical protein BKA83DRAFT_14986 [Pisolithus microcarpus]
MVNRGPRENSFPGNNFRKNLAITLLSAKPKGISDLTMLECTQIIAAIRDHGPLRLHFKFDPNSKLDLLASKSPVIIGAPPLHDSKSSKAKRIFYNGKTDYDGPARLPNPAMTRIKRQVGGGKSTNRTPEDDEHSSLSPSPAPRTLRSTLHKGAVEDWHSSVKGAPKSRNDHKKVEVVITTTANKVGKWPPSIITVGDSSEPGETSIGLEDKEVPNDYGELFLSEDEQAPSTRKRKLKSQQSLRPGKRVATSLNTKSMQLSEPKVMKALSRTKSAPKKRLRIISPFDSDSSSEERPPGTITTRDSSAKQLATPLEIDTTQPSSSKAVKDLSQSRPALKKTKLRFISPLSSEELETHALGDELNATSSRACTEHQQPSEELYTKQPAGLQVALSPPKENQLANPPSHASNPDELPNLPSEEPPHDEGESLAVYFMFCLIKLP